MNALAEFTGRFTLALIFFSSGLNKVFSFSQTQEYMAVHGLPLTGILLPLAIAVEIGGAISIVSGFYARVGAGLLVLFLIPASIIFHLDLGDRIQMLMLLKNIAILGGLLLVTVHGSGKYSIRPEAEGRR